MRGLTPAEYELLEQVENPTSQESTPEEIRAARQLVAYGRLRIVRCPYHPNGDHMLPIITLAGHEALRLHRLLKSWGAT